jgi:putative ABC transport system substrate-binding protein
LRQGLKEAGFVEGQNVAIEYRFAESQGDRLPGLVADLIRDQVAVIIGHALPAQIAKAATTTTPIVFVVGDDPVRIGLVSNLNRPGGNVTGVAFIATDATTKRLGLLHELVPREAVTAVLLDPNLPDADEELRTLEAAGRRCRAAGPVERWRTRSASSGGSGVGYSLGRFLLRPPTPSCNQWTEED